RAVLVEHDYGRGTAVGDRATSGVGGGITHAAEKIPLAACGGTGAVAGRRGIGRGAILSRYAVGRLVGDVAAGYNSKAMAYGVVKCQRPSPLPSPGIQGEGERFACPHG